jgi:hypothetical protein
VESGLTTVKPCRDDQLWKRKSLSLEFEMVSGIVSGFKQ